MNKHQLRQALLKARLSLSAQDWRSASDRICQHLQSSDLFHHAHTVLAYFSIRQEPDLSPLFSLPKVWGFPRCVAQSLAWHRWSPNDPLPLLAGAYGIPEPHPAAPVLDAGAVDLLLVPALAWDRRGYRLGYGGGFYDRLLSDPAWAKKPTIAITFALAELDTIPIDQWDRPLTAICTENSIRLVDDASPL